MQNMSKMCCCRHFSEDWIRKVDRINLKVAQEKKLCIQMIPKALRKKPKPERLGTRLTLWSGRPSPPLI